MSLEPEKFFVGLTDFFSILLPGAFATYLMKDALGPRVLRDGYKALTGTEGWIAFLFGSYLLGHFVFLLGSLLLDDHVYDRIRTATYGEQIKRLALGRKPSSKLSRWLATRVIKKNADRALAQAVLIKDHYVGALQGSPAINAFQWSKARLTLEHPEAMATINRFEADSKFFRSLVVVLGALIPLGVLEANREVAIVGAVLLVPALWRYIDQRVRATTQAYWYVMTSESLTRQGQDWARSVPDGITYAGGVVVRRARDGDEYLVTEARDSASEWVLPKGHVAHGERTQETAVREVREETGVWARIKAPLRVDSFLVKAQRVQVQFFLMEALEEATPAEGRQHMWLPLDKAIEELREENREVLNAAATMQRRGKRLLRESQMNPS